MTIEITHDDRVGDGIDASLGIQEMRNAFFW
jgi:hypothetical protein